jgi:predicted TIM-barrel fold metal-dependent hydrolase
MAYALNVIVDCHTHLFPPFVIAERDRYLAADATFAELYGSQKAKLATAEDLLLSMDAAGIDVSIALGFAWRDEETCHRHNDYLIEAAATSEGRIVPFCNLPLASPRAAIEAEMRRCAAAGVRGFGELRPDNLNFDLAADDGSFLGAIAAELDVALLFHASEPVGHAYPGKQGLAMDTLYRFIQKHPAVRVVAAHWGGGLPFHALMPEVKLAIQNTSFDTAGTSLLYTPEVYLLASEVVGAEHIVFGSDFPLLSQARSRARSEESRLSAEAISLILGENARKLLRLD